MKLKEKIKNKINAFKANTRHFSVLSLDEWLISQGLEENAKNRALYAQYKLELDTKNKRQDMNLSKFIGSAIFLVVFLVIFFVMCANSISASTICYQTEEFTDSVQSDGFNGNIRYGGYDFDLTTYSHIQSEIYTYVIEEPLSLVDCITLYADGLTIDQTLCFEFFSSFYYGNDNDVYIIGLNLYNNAYDIYLTCVEYKNELLNAHSEGYSQGYRVGESVGLQTGDTLRKGIFAIFDAPVQMLQQILNFEIMGINLYSIFTFIVTLCLLAILTKTILGLFS